MAHHTGLREMVQEMGHSTGVVDMNMGQPDVIRPWPIPLGLELA